MNSESRLIVKRIMDVGLAIVGLIFAAPLLLVCAIAIKLNSRGPLFFRLRVAGLGGRGFDQWKLRTMIERARESGDRFETSSSDPRSDIFCGAGVSMNCRNCGMYFAGR